MIWMCARPWRDARGWRGELGAVEGAGAGAMMLTCVCCGEGSGGRRTRGGRV